MTKLTWPCWFSSPDGSQSAIFTHESDVPCGWTSGAEKITVEGASAPAPKLEKQPMAAPTAKLEKSAAPLADAVDADGHKFDPTMHTGTMTKAGLWRMKVGKTRPAAITKPLDL